MVGDFDDCLRRLQALLPGSWFRNASADIDGLLAGIADNEAFLYALAQYAKGQTRLGTTTDGFLELTALDFFGTSFPRRVGETDPFYRDRILAELFRERATRKGITAALVNLTGVAPKIVEPWNAGDCGAYDGVGLAYAGSDFVPSPSGAYDRSGAYDTGLTSYDALTATAGNTSTGMGCWGSLEVPYQLFVTAYRPATGGIPGATGFDVGGGYDVGAGLQYTDASEVASPVSDAEIYAAVASSHPAGVIPWTAIQDAPAT